MLCKSIVFGDISVISHGLTIFQINMAKYIHPHRYVYMHVNTCESVCVHT